MTLWNLKSLHIYTYLLSHITSCCFYTNIKKHAIGQFTDIRAPSVTVLCHLCDARGALCTFLCENAACSRSFIHMIRAYFREMSEWITREVAFYFIVLLLQINFRLIVFNAAIERRDTNLSGLNSEKFYIRDIKFFM